MEPAGVQASWKRDGYAVLERAVPHDAIDALNAEIAEFRRTCKETKDEYGYGQRIGLFHASNARSLDVARNERVRSFLEWALDDEPLLYGSLTFEAGTEQAAHVDSIFFFTAPPFAMAGCWTALEDVHPDAGPLFYYPGSQLWPFDRGEDVLRRYPDLADGVRRLREAKDANGLAKIAGALGNCWTSMLNEKITRAKCEPVPALVKKGDVVVWHARLVHGGLPRRDRSLSRKSMVTHYIGRNALMFDMASFFTLRNHEFTKKTAYGLEVVADPGGAYARHGSVVTY
jgi:ectoine hydroxylase-related dioxygenase (phytanoyl-CoA dioxygenase family)